MKEGGAPRLLLLAAVAAVMASAASGQTIGSESRAKELIRRFPYMVSIRGDEKTGGKHFCAGVLTNSHLAVTSAACMDATATAEAVRLPKLVIGSHAADPELDSDITGRFLELRSAAEVVFHPGWSGDPAGGSDIAAVILDEPVPGTFTLESGEELRRTAKLPPSDYERPEGTDVRVLGYGRLGQASGSASVLQEGPMRLVSDARCEPPVGGDGQLSKGQLCAGGTRTEPCSGDQGSPLIKRGPSNDSRDDVLLGLVSRTSNPCGQGKDVVFTSIPEFEAWILSVACETGRRLGGTVAKDVDLLCQFVELEREAKKRGKRKD